MRARPRGRIEVELEGRVWRTMPAEVVLAAGLDVGIELDRVRARRVRRELRRHEAMARAARSLARRDLSERELTERVARAEIAPAASGEAVDRLLRAGAIDDERLALRRAELLAERGAGDELIRHDLAKRAIAAESIERALAALEPELDRAARLVEGREASVKTARYLARKGFAQDSIDAACGDPIAEDAPPAVP